MLEVGDNRQTETEEARKLIGRAFTRASVIFAVFTVIVLSILLYNNQRIRTTDPLKSSVIASLKKDLHDNPQDEGIKAHIRKVDLNLRREYLRRLDFSMKGEYILLTGIAGLLATLAAAGYYRRRIALPEAQAGGNLSSRTAAARSAVSALGAIALIGMILLVFASRSNHDTEYAKAVRDYRAATIRNTAINPLEGLPPEMLQNLAGRKNTTETAQTSAQPITVPPTPVAPIKPLPSIAGSGAANPALSTVSTTSTANADSSKPAPTPANKASGPEASFDANDYSPSAQEFASNWPVFRGPMPGTVAGTFPTRWNGNTGEGIAWKSKVLLPGWNSPVVWGDRVFLTGADEKNRAIYCFDASNGKMLWTKSVKPISPGKLPDLSDFSGYAAPTTATDGKRVFAIFPNGDVFACTFDGKVLWARSLGMPESQYGYASSLTSFRSLLIIQFDQASADDGKSALVALQGATGKIVWRTKRPVGGSWASPIAVRSGDQGMVIANANPWAIAYDALSGKELWRANVIAGDVAPSPAFAGDTAYVCNLGAVLAAIRSDGSGDVTKSKVVWRASDGLPDTTSPAANGDFVFLASTDGTVTCYDAKTGKKLWEHAYAENTFKASPIIVGNLVYLLDTEGNMHVISAKPTFEETATSALGEKTSATPAFIGGRIYIRGENNLFCISTKR
jgi:outer membrane protein assembly factor BamB